MTGSKDALRAALEEAPLSRRDSFYLPAAASFLGSQPLLTRRGTLLFRHIQKANKFPATKQR